MYETNLTSYSRNTFSNILPFCVYVNGFYFFKGNAVVHFMTPEARNKYELEKLWSLGPRYDDQFRSALKQLALRGDLPK